MVPAGGEISLPTISADMGHVLVHYLYKGAYQTLESSISGIAQQPQPALKQALLVYRASVTYALDGLEQLARQQIEENSASMDLKTILDITRSELPKKTEPSGWLQAYLKDRIQKAFEKDHTVFADDAFCEGLCKKSKLNDYVMHQVVKLLSEKLTEALAGKANVAHELDFARPPPVPEEIVADKDPFAGLSKIKKKKLEKKMKQEKEKARLEEEGAEAAALVQYGNIVDERSPAPDVGEEPSPVEEPETLSIPAPEAEPCYELSLPAPEAEPYYESSLPAPEAEPCFEESILAPEVEPCFAESIDVIDSEPQGKEPPAPEHRAEYVPPPPPKKETYKTKKKRLAQEKQDKEKWNKEQQERIDREEKKAPCEEPAPTSDTCWTDPAPPAESDSSWEHAVPVSVDEVEPVYNHSIPAEPEPLFEVPPPELIPVSDHPQEAVCI
jgi:hypothetical protein